MSILTLQRRLMEAGRIRIGQQVPTSNGKTRPAKLETFRLTSRDRQKIDQAAQLWGGTPEPWDSPSGKQWQVVTDADVLDVIVPPSEMAFSQYLELWSAGGCQRRCDGVTELISDQPCLCDPEAPECKIHTRLSVMLRDLPGLGVWRVETSGYYAAVELGGSVQVIAAAAGRGAMLPARLRLEQRSVKRPGKDGTPQTLRFAVPVLDIDVSPGQLIAGMGQTVTIENSQTVREALDGPKPKLLEPVPQSVTEAPVASIAEQATTFPERKPRSNAAQPIPSTGIEPRTVAEVQAEAEERQEPLGDDAVAELITLLGPDPKSSSTMEVLEADLRKLYRLMEQAGIPKWGRDGDGVDALHRALRVKAGADHVGDLRKPELVEFCRVSWDAARAAVKAHDERPFGEEE